MEQAETELESAHTRSSDLESSISAVEDQLQDARASIANLKLSLEEITSDRDGVMGKLEKAANENAALRSAQAETDLSFDELAGKLQAAEEIGGKAREETAGENLKDVRNCSINCRIHAFSQNILKQV